MPEAIPAAVLQVFFPACLALCLLGVAVRFLLGPTVFDRLAALESFSLTFLCLVAVLGLAFDTGWFLDFILVYSLVGYLVTVAVARYLARGSIVDD